MMDARGNFQEVLDRYLAGLVASGSIRDGVAVVVRELFGDAGRELGLAASCRASGDILKASEHMVNVNLMIHQAATEVALRAEESFRDKVRESTTVFLREVFMAVAVVIFKAIPGVKR
jgi:hypothetical protein